MGLFEQFPYTNFHELNLDWVIATVKALDERVNNIQEAILALANAYTDSQIAEVRADFLELEGDFNDFVTAVNRQFTEYTNQQNKNFQDFQKLVNAQLTVIRGEIATARLEMQTVLNQANEYTDVQIATISEKLPNYVDAAIPKGKVYNILEATYMTIQNMFDYLCNLHNPNALMCMAVAERKNTCSQIYGYNQTCKAFLTNAANIIIQEV